MRDKELIIDTDSLEQLEPIIKELGISKLYIDPSKVKDKDDLTIIHESLDADHVITNSIDEIEGLKDKGKMVGFRIDIKSKEDEDRIALASSKGADFVVVEARDWKIIPLENIIARLHNSNTKVYARADSIDEIRTMFNVLQLGVDGVITRMKDPSSIKEALAYMHALRFDLKPVKVIEVKDAGVGERVCVDTTSILKYGEGMLVGNRSNFLFLIHNESIGSAFTSPRPFRVNAGAVHCYTIMPNGKTKYLSEIEAGDEVLIIDSKGDARRVTVGRAKIETRPMLLVKARYDDEIGSIIAQNAETIRFVKSNGSLIPITELKEGDEILANISKSKGRHFGMEVDEYIMEK